MKVVSIVLIVLALMTTSALVSARQPRGPRGAETPSTCDPGNVHSMRDLIWFTRHCRTRIVQEAEVTSSGNQLPSDTPTETQQPYIPPWHCWKDPRCYYTPSPTVTRTPTNTRTPTPEGWQPTPYP